MPVALVTGASRGIGRVIAVYLARAGYDIALAARTVEEGERREHSLTVHRSDTKHLPGSLSSTADLVEAEGVRSLAIPMDLADRTSVVAAAGTVLETWGQVDLLVNNGVYVGPGFVDRFEETPLALIDVAIEVNVMAPLALIQQVLPGMLDRGSGCIVNITSAAAYMDPPRIAVEGGWAMGYGISKGALHRIAGVLAVELGARGIRAYSVQPGSVATERRRLDTGESGFDPQGGVPPEVIGAVVAWLVTDPAAAQPNGRCVEAQQVCRELGLLPGWPS